MRALPLLVLMCFGCQAEMPPAGHVWSVDTTSATWLQPDGAAELVATMAASYPFFMGTWATEGNQATLILVIGDEGDQDFCSRTVLMPSITVRRDQSFGFGPADFTIANGFTIEDFAMTGQFSDDFEQVSEMAFTGNLNLATAPPEMLLGGGDTTACELVESFQMACNACRDGSDECLNAQVIGAEATRAPDITLIEIDQADCHAQCEASAANPECPQ